MRDHGLDRDAAFFEQRQVIPPDRVGAQPIETPTGLAAKVLNDADVAPTVIGEYWRRTSSSCSRWSSLVTGNTSCDAPYSSTNHPAARRPPRQRLRSSREV